MTSQPSGRARIDFLLRVCSVRAAQIERLDRELADSQNALANSQEQQRQLETALANRDAQIQQYDATIAALNEQMRDLLVVQAPSPPEIDVREVCFVFMLLFSTCLLVDRRRQRSIRRI